MALNEISAAQGGDLEDHPAAADDGAKGTTVAAEVCSTIEISRRISDQTGQGRCPVRSAGETVQHGLLAGLIQLEHRSAATPVECRDRYAQNSLDTADIVREVIFHQLSKRTHLPWCLE